MPTPRRILFTSLDHPMLKLAGLDDILSCYHENVYPDRDTYYFFDEIQYAADWDLWLKTLYDTQPQSTVMGTGSASPILARRSSESGVGRWTVIPAPTLSFFEYKSVAIALRNRYRRNLLSDEMREEITPKKRE